MAPENRPFQKRKFIFQPLIFRGYISLRKGVLDGCSWHVGGSMAEVTPPLRMARLKTGCLQQKEPPLFTFINMCLGQGRVRVSDPFHSRTSSVICCVGISARITIWRLNISNGEGPSGTNIILAIKKAYKKQQNESEKSLSTNFPSNFPHLEGGLQFNTDKHDLFN